MKNLRVQKTTLCHDPADFAELSELCFHGSGQTWTFQVPDPPHSSPTMPWSCFGTVWHSQAGKEARHLDVRGACTSWRSCKAGPSFASSQSSFCPSACCGVVQRLWFQGLCCWGPESFLSLEFISAWRMWKKKKGSALKQACCNEPMPVAHKRLRAFATLLSRCRAVGPSWKQWCPHCAKPQYCAFRVSTWGPYTIDSVVANVRRFTKSWPLAQWKHT